MRSHAKAIVAISALLLLTLALGVTLASATAPTVTIEPASSVSHTSAHVSGTVNAEDNSTYYSFEYSADPAAEGWSGFTYQGPLAAGSGSQNVSSELTGLKTGTTYFVRLAATNFVDPEVFSSEPSFTTGAVSDPNISLDPVTAFTGTTAHFSGEINPEAPSGNPAAFDVSWHFECMPACPGLTGGTIAADSSTHEVSADATGLKPGTAYEVSLVASNAGGSTSAGPEPFATPTIAPLVESTHATSLATEAMLDSSINPGGLETTYRFEYGLSESYGQSTVTKTIPAGAVPVSVNANLFGLLPASTYHLRLVAANAVGITKGDDLTFSTSKQSAASESCSNEAVREQQGATGLPSCRAYEQVTPVDKGGASIFHYPALPSPIVGGGLGITSAIRDDGNAVVFRSILPWWDSSSGLYQSWIAERDGGGNWRQAALSPATADAHPRLSLETAVDDTNDDYSVFFANTFDALDPADTAPAPPGLPGTMNGYVREENGAWRLIAPETGSWTAGTTYVGSTPDGDQVLFESTENVGVAATKSPEPSMLWSWNRKTGEVDPVAVDDSGQLVDQCGGALSGSGHGNNQASTPFSQSISQDGSRIVFATPGSGSSFAGECSGPAHSGVFVRINGETTLDVSRSRLAVPEEPKAKVFVGADKEIQHVIFKSEERLLESASPGGGLYRFDLSDQSLHFLTPPVSGEARIGEVSRVSRDGSKILFEARGDLDPDRPNTAGEPALFVYDNGDVTKLGPGIVSGSVARESATQAAFSLDGRWLAFRSTEDLVGDSAAGIPQVYLYDVQGRSLTCASCPGGGAEPSLPAALPIETYTSPGGRVPVPRFVDNDGHVYFDTASRLSSRDSNSRVDVYDYSTAGGARLISGGNGPNDSSLMGISTSGDSVFFSTSDSLVSADRDQGDLDVYDARVGGGLEQSSADPPCSQSECQGPPARSPDSSQPGSGQLRASGNARGRRDRPRSKCRKAAHKARRLGDRAQRLNQVMNASSSAQTSVKTLRRQVDRLERRAERQRDAAKRCSRQSKRTPR